MQLIGARVKRRRTLADLLPVAVLLGLLLLVGPQIGRGIQSNIDLPPGLLQPQPRVEGTLLTGRPWRADAGNRLMIGVVPLVLADIVPPAAGTVSAERARRALETLAVGIELRCTDTGARAAAVELARCVDPWGRDVATQLVRAGYVAAAPTAVLQQVSR